MRTGKVGSIVRIAVLCIVALSIAPFSAYGVEELIVNDGSGNAQFVVTDSGQVTAPTATGMIGVGTATPQGELYVVDQTGTNAQRGIVSAQHCNSQNGSNILSKRSRGTEAAPIALQSADKVGNISAMVYDGTQYMITSSIIYQVNGTVATNQVPTDIVFWTGSAQTGGTNPRVERMRLTSTGDLGIGTSNPTYPIQLGGGAYTDGFTWVNASSRDLKENILALNAVDAEKTLNGLTPVTYNYKVNKYQNHVGFIAEDVPEMVAMQDRKGLSPMDVVAVLTKVVQDKSQIVESQQKIVESQQKTLAALSATVAKLEAEVNKLKSKDVLAQK